MTTKKRLYYTDSNGVKTPLPMYNVNDMGVSECKRDIQNLNKVATRTENGLMSKTDKTKLDELDQNVLTIALETANSASTTAVETSEKAETMLNKVNTSINDLSALINKITVTSAASTAQQVTYSNTNSGINSTTVQGALDVISPDINLSGTGHSAEAEAVGNVLFVISEALNNIKLDVESLISLIKDGYLGDINSDSINVNNSNGYMTFGSPNIIQSAGTPTRVADFIGQEYLDTTNNIWYKASRIDSVSYWKRISNA